MLDRRTLVLRDGRTLLSPTGRLLRLSKPVSELREGELRDRLVDAGAAHPLPDPRPAEDVTVVVPVKDRLTELGRCLAANRGRDVLVVDDGSAEPAAVDALCRRHGAQVLHRGNGGPAAARNTALPLLRKDFVAFLDSDCEPPDGWLEQLRGHFDDPQVAAVAPRVTGGLRSPLDLGTDPGRVQDVAQLDQTGLALVLLQGASGQA